MAGGCGVTNNSSFDQSTIVEMAVEHCPGQLRTAGYAQIPIFGNSNPHGGNLETQDLNQVIAGLDPTTPEIGVLTATLNVQALTSGSGIANRPPDYWRLFETCGWYSTRTASIAGPAAATFAAAAVGSGGSMEAGDYGYGFTVLYQSNGTTPATSLANAAFESNLSADTDTVTCVANDSVGLSNLPSSGIKVIYRTNVDDETGRMYKVGMVADGVTTFTDTRHERDLDEAAPVELVDPDETDFAVDDGTTVGAGNVDVGAHQYFFADLYDRDGVLVEGRANLSAAVYMSQISAAQTATIASTDKAVTVTLPTDNNGLKVIYRTKAGVTGIANAFRVGVADPLELATFVDNTADDDLIVPVEVPVDEAIMTPAGDPNDHLALSSKTFMNGRRKTMQGGRGNWTMAGTTGQTVPITFDHQGASPASAAEANPASATRVETAPKLCEAGFFLRRSAAPTVYFAPKIQSVNVNAGRSPAPRLDGNASCDTSGVTEYVLGNRSNASLQVVHEMNVTMDFEGDAKARVGYEWQFQIGTTARSRIFVGNYVPWEDRFLSVQNQYPATAGLPSGNRGETLNLVIAGTGNNFLRMRHR